jgi:hypothetical protein
MILYVNREQSPQPQSTIIRWLTNTYVCIMSLQGNPIKSINRVSEINGLINLTPYEIYVTEQK